VDGKRGKRELIAQDVAAIYLHSLLQYNPNIPEKDIRSAIDAKHDQYIFVDREGNRISTEALGGSFRQFLELHDMVSGADGKTRTLYSLRHTYATNALAEGRNIHQLAVQMGTSVKMLEQHYSKVSARLNAEEHSGRTKYT